MKQSKKVCLLVFYTILLTFACLYPKIHIPDNGISFFDKLQHISAYILLMYLCLWTFYNNEVGFFKIIVCFGILTFYGLVIEVLQNFTGRSMELLDLLADIVGLFIGYFFYRLINIRNYKLKNK